MFRKFKNITSTDFGIAFVIALAWQLITTVVFVILTKEWNDPLGYMTQWDGGWYLEIIRDKYVTNEASAVFYPLFPFTISVLSEATFHLLPYTVLSFILNTVCLWLAITALFTIAQFFTDKHYKLSVLFLLAAPAAIFMNFFYTEAIFVAIGFWAYAFALKQKWLAMAILLALLTACRLPSLLFVGLCALEFLRIHDWNIKKASNVNVLYFLLAPLGFIVYGLYLQIARGDFLGMFHGYDANNDWEYHTFEPNIIRTVGRVAFEIFKSVAGERPFNNDIFINHALPIFCLGILALTSLYLIFRVRGRGTPLGIFGLVSFVFFTLNNNVVSAHRYILACLGIYIALTLFVSRSHQLKLVAVIISVIMIIFQITIIVLKTHGVFIG